MNKKVRFGIIYKVSSPSGKCYIGQTVRSLDKRKKDHLRAAFNKKYHHFNSKFSYAIRKYNNLLVWEILENNVQEINLNNQEKYFIKLFNSYNNGYNSDLGGGGLGTPKSSLTIEKIRNSKLGKKLSPEHKQSISSSSPFKNIGFMKGKNHSIFSKEKISKAASGENNPFYGKKHTEKERSKMKLAWQNRKINKRDENGRFIKEII